MEWRYSLDISMRQVYTINLCTTLKGYRQTAFKGSLDIFLARLKKSTLHMLQYVDMGQQTFRNEMFEGYKQNRPAPPAELIPQFDYVKEISQQFGFVNVGVSNYEADDVIGSLAKEYSEHNNVYIITGDRDILQCINDNVEVWLTKRGSRFTIDIR